MINDQTFAIVVLALVTLVALTRSGDGGQTPPGQALLKAIIEITKNLHK